MADSLETSPAGLHVERHIELVGAPCDRFRLSTEEDVRWEYLTSGQLVSYKSSAMPRLVLNEILHRFTDVDPRRPDIYSFC